MLTVPTRRLCRKTWLGFEEVPAPSPCLEGLGQQQDGSAQPHDAASLADEDLREAPGSVKSVYLVTLPALRSGCAPRGYVCPSTWSHDDILRVFLAVFNAGPEHEGAGRLTLECVTVFRERHAGQDGAPGPYHWHVALKASSSFRFVSYKRIFHVEHGLATHWSCTHMGYWSAVRYGFMPSPKKQQDELDPHPRSWARSGEHPPLFEACQEPLTASALSRRREKKVKDAAGGGKPEPRPTEMDLYAVIVKNGFRNTPDDSNAASRLVAFLKAHGTPALVAYAFKNRAKLPGLIDDVWSWEKVDAYLEALAKSRLDQLYAAAAMPCMCQGRWALQALEALSRNSLCPELFCKDVFRLLRDGRRPDVPVMVLMGRFGGEGKSFLLAPLRALYGPGHVQSTPQRGNFPLLGLETKKVVLLDDWCFDDTILPLPTRGNLSHFHALKTAAIIRGICCMREQHPFSSQ